MAADLSLSRLYKQTTQLTTLSRHPPFLSFSLRNPVTGATHCSAGSPTPPLLLIELPPSSD
ncbi:hypothetical protein HanPSC8_Chr04g0162731 [Helianthus annuus]|nr:hypothetical protein HanIR_Chr05g0254111 [Helianthus annuus]KAJ0579005.1 hypothetical protein HanIR_Chr05g0254141 [Helianthus annuus]KAJ0924427.1 hypothetical protein HanPSC8_Chr05g0228041 [Helianthus annuus]KAJ0931530.1 hypothetical protein HanPSC8_Chr04g0162731 [Helianthus annuus]